MYHKIINGNTPPYLESLLSAPVSSVKAHRKRRPHELIIPPHKTELCTSSFFPATTILWNNLPENIQCSTFISELKRYLQRTGHVVSPHFYTGIRHPQIVQAKLLHTSDLKQGLVERFIK